MGNNKEVIFNQNRKCVSFAVTFHLKLKQDELAKTLALPLDKKLTQKLFLDKKFSDVKIFCEDKTFECHKAVLCLQSEVFERMLANNSMAESISGEIKATETSAITLEALLYFLYNENLDGSKITGDLLIAADYYMVHPLVNFCKCTYLYLQKTYRIILPYAFVYLFSSLVYWSK